MHPLAPDLTGLTEEELHSKRAELQNRANFAYRMGNTDIAGQISLLLYDYDMEIQTRNQRLLDTAQRTGRLGTTNTHNNPDVINITKE